MAYYAVFLDLERRPCIVVGGGEVAHRKVEGLLRAGAKVSVIAPEITAPLATLVRDGRIEWRSREWEGRDLEDALLVVAAVDDPELQRRVSAAAMAANRPVNVVDVPELCSFIAPAVLERGDLQIAVSTSGAAPALAGVIRDRIAREIGPEYDLVLRILRRLREHLREKHTAAADRQRIFRRLADSALPDRVKAGDRAGVQEVLVRAAGLDASLESLGIVLD